MVTSEDRRASDSRAGEEGQGLVEYSLILFLVALAVVVILGVLGQNLGAYYDKIVAALPF